jgi:DNA mismatch repair protein MutS
MEDAERARTGITSLKIRYNRVFGYYIEISKSNLGNVPPDYHRKQTIAGGERFITPALKEYEEKVVGADEHSLEREVAIFGASVHASPTRRADSGTARGRRRSTCCRLCNTAAAHNYTKPLIRGDELAGRRGAPSRDRRLVATFVPNDVARFHDVNSSS